MRSAVAVAVLAAGLTPAPAGAAAAPKPTSPAARQAPYSAVAHKLLLKAPVKAKATASFRATGVANVPATASAVVVSVSIPKPIASGALTFFAYGTKRPATVSLVYAKAVTATATVVLIPGKAGKVSVYNASARGDKVVVTVLGFYAAPGTTAAAHAKTRFVPLAPKRVAALLLAKTAASFATGVPPTGVAGVVLSVTVPAPTSSGSLSLYGFGAKAGAADFSFAAHHPASSLVVVPVGSKGRVSVLRHAKAAVRVWVDVVGYLHQLKAPSAPRSVNVTAQNGGALITWSAPASDGGAPVAAYRIGVSPAGTTMVVPGLALQTSVGGLKNGTAYTISVVAVNSVGDGPAAVSAAVIPYGVPAAPTNVVATAAGVGAVNVTWTAPTVTGGLPIVGYRVVASPGGVTVTAATSPAAVTGLASGQVYTFTVVATNGGSPSLASAPSNAVIGEGLSRVSISGAGAEGDNDSGGGASISADGRYVVFSSLANNLTPEDTNPKGDVFLRDRLLGTTSLVSVAVPGTVNNGDDSGAPTISADGRYVAFESFATNLVTPATTHGDVFVRDLVAGTTQLLSTSYLTGAEANQNSVEPVISADGSTIAFQSAASDLTPTDGNVFKDVFIANRVTGVVRAVSVTPGGVTGDGTSGDVSLSADGRYAAFDSVATNLVTGFVTGAHRQIYVYDAANRTTRAVSLSAAMANYGGNDDSQRPSISADEHYVAYESLATDLGPTDGNAFGDVYLFNTQTGAATRVSRPASGPETVNNSTEARISADGRYVVFESPAANIVLGDVNTAADVFRYDATTGQTQLLTTANSGAQGNDFSGSYAVSADGQHVVLWSSATNLVTDDKNGHVDTFVRDLG